MTPLTYRMACKEAIEAPWTTAIGLGEELLAVGIKLLALIVQLILAVLFPLTALLHVAVHKANIQNRARKRAEREAARDCLVSSAPNKD